MGVASKDQQRRETDTVGLVPKVSLFETQSACRGEYDGGFLFCFGLRTWTVFGGFFLATFAFCSLKHVMPYFFFFFFLLAKCMYSKALML